jgi:hypothetical protein
MVILKQKRRKKVDAKADDRSRSHKKPRLDLATPAEFRVFSVARQLNQLRARRLAARLKFPMATNSMTMREARMEDIRNIITDNDTGEALRIILDVAVEYAQSNPEYRRTIATITATFLNQKTTMPSQEPDISSKLISLSQRCESKTRMVRRMLDKYSRPDSPL